MSLVESVGEPLPAVSFVHRLLVRGRLLSSVLIIDFAVAKDKKLSVSIMSQSCSESATGVSAVVGTLLGGTEASESN